MEDSVIANEIILKILSTAIYDFEVRIYDQIFRFAFSDKGKYKVRSGFVDNGNTSAYVSYMRSLACTYKNKGERYEIHLAVRIAELKKSNCLLSDGKEYTIILGFPPAHDDTRLNFFKAMKRGWQFYGITSFKKRNLSNAKRKEAFHHHLRNIGFAINKDGGIYLGEFNPEKNEFLPSFRQFLENLMQFSILKAHFLHRIKILGLKKIS